LAELMFGRVSLNASGWVLAAACRREVVTCVAVQGYGDLKHAVGVDLNAGMLEVARAPTPAIYIPMNGSRAMCVQWPRWSETGVVNHPSGIYLH
jgi:hypothetical protein